MRWNEPKSRQVDFKDPALPYNGLVAEASPRELTASAAPESGPRRWSFRQRIVLSLIVAVGNVVIRLIGATLRIAVSS